MRTLLTNDDGLRAPGLLALYNALLDLPIRGHSKGRFGGAMKGPAGSGKNPTGGTAVPLTEVIPIAPLTVQSATSHGVTFHTPLMTESQSIREGHLGMAVDGRPADCVKLAISNLWPERFGAGSRPDLLISGMNAGANCGINVIYSGTVAAAIEGAFLGVPSIAVSLHLGKGRPRFDVAAARGRRAIEAVIARGLPSAHECISINIPITEYPADFVEGGIDTAMPPEPPMPEIRVCPMNTHGLVDKYERRVSPAGQVYYWAAGHGLDFHHTEPGSDVDELKRGYITVTPLMYDLTRHGDLPKLVERLR